MSEEALTALLINVIAVVGSIFASAGFWGYINGLVSARKKYETSERMLLMGLASITITRIASLYIHRGFITHDEYKTLKEYLVDPYIALGGNGTTKRLMSEIDKLPIKENKND